MLCPEVWNFTPPAHHISFKKGNFNGEESKCADLIDFHFYNHLVSVVLPDTINVPDIIKDSLSEDCDYYKVEQLSVGELINKEFIEAFVKKGKITILSVDTRIDTDDCAAVLPSGHLILTLNKETYQQLGLEGKPSFFCRANPERYVVRLDLKEKHFTPGKKNYGRVKRCLTDNVQLKMNFLVAWDPPEENICPSSVAAYLSSRGHKVSLCQPKMSKHVTYNVKVPVLPEIEDTESVQEHIEWLGILSTGGDLEPDAENDFVNSYKCPLETLEIGSCTHLKWTGYFTYNQIHRLYDELRKYVAGRRGIPWLSMYVQGFADSPVSWNVKEHCFYTDGDNNYVIYMKPDGTYWTCSYISSNKRPKSKP